MKKIIALLVLATVTGWLLSNINRQESVDTDIKENESVETDINEKETAAAKIPDELKAVKGEKKEPAKLTATSDVKPEEMHDRTEYSSQTAEFILGKKTIEFSLDERWSKAQTLAENNDLTEARRLLTEVYLSGAPDFQEKARQKLEEINDRLIFDPSYASNATVHRVKRGETLGAIARNYGVNWRMLVRINNISRPEMIRVNQPIKILEGKPRILIDKTRFTLTLFIDDYFVKEYPIGLGRENRTPTGTFKVDSMLIEADWYPPSGGVIRYGEEGHLIGNRWIGFEDTPEAAGYGIHGTNDPDSIGGMESDGCIRLQNEDVEELYDFLVSGTEVKIID